jgi:hypothetical protein
MKPMNMFDIGRICMALDAEGAEAVAIYRDKLSANIRNEAVYQDFVYEGIAAFTFLQAGFHVRMHESPDLAVMWGSSMLLAEVKHFRWKEQDEIDERLLGEVVNAGCLVSYGDTVPSEDSAPWEQVLAVAKRKTPQYREGFPNVLVIASSSTYAIDDAIMPTVVAMINEASRTPAGAGLRKLNGLLLLDRNFSLAHRRNTWFFETDNAVIPLEERVRAALEGIRVWSTPA